MYKVVRLKKTGKSEEEAEEELNEIARDGWELVTMSGNVGAFVISIWKKKDPRFREDDEKAR